MTTTQWKFIISSTSRAGEANIERSQRASRRERRRMLQTTFPHQNYTLIRSALGTSGRCRGRCHGCPRALAGPTSTSLRASSSKLSCKEGDRLKQVVQNPSLELELHRRGRRTCVLAVRGGIWPRGVHTTRQSAPLLCDRAQSGSSRAAVYFFCSCFVQQSCGCCCSAKLVVVVHVLVPRSSCAVSTTPRVVGLRGGGGSRRGC
mmetsp:Transcript_23625/g.59707  ORF Transcript_23625/g.59707 Transcript_23625/m.59707 type:complete len:204 (-) Transcript_23625:53-664(-)